MNEDSELLRRFADEGAQDAFAELVQRKVALVYAAALRQAGGDAHLAQDVTQGVFLALASRAGVLKRHAALTGWLYTTTRFVAAKAVRAQARWQRREREANAMNPVAGTEDGAWAELRSVIDAAMHELAEKDRIALLLRFFEGRPLAEVGAALGVAENAARMRVERALEKLRARLARHGITSTAAALGVALANQPAVAVPAGLAARAAGASFAGVAVGGAGLLTGMGTSFAFMGAMKIVTGVAALVAIGALGAYLGAQQTLFARAASAPAAPNNSAALADLRAENRRLQDALAARGTPPDAARASGAAPRNAAAGASSAPLEALRVVVDLQRRHVVTPDVTLFARGAQLTPQFVELFALQPDERLTLERSIERTRERLAALEKENTTIEQPEDGKVTIALKAFPEAGGAAYDALLKTFADALGAERYRAFMALGADQMEKNLGRFGATQRDIAITRMQDPEGPVVYRIHDVQRADRDNANYVSDFMTAERLREEMGSLFDLLPPKFAPRK